MKCADLLSYLETGGPLRRMQARRHAARCPRCAGILAAFDGAKRQLADVEPLSPRERHLWTQAVDASAEEADGGVRLGPMEEQRRSRRAPVARRWVPAAAGLVAACLALSLIGPLVWHSSARREPGPAPVAEITVERLTPAAEWSAFAANVERLQEQVQRLKEQAARRQAGQAVVLVLDRYGRW